MKALRGQQYISIHFKNHAGASGETKVISSIKPEGYTLGTEDFKLKIVFKHKYFDSVIFHGVDEGGTGRRILLNGKRELTFQPSESPTEYMDVVVTAGPQFNRKKFIYLFVCLFVCF